MRPCCHLLHAAALRNNEGEGLLREASGIEYTIIRPGVMSRPGELPPSSLALADDGADLKVTTIPHSAIAELCVASLDYPNAAGATLTAVQSPTAGGETPHVLKPRPTATHLFKQPYKSTINPALSRRAGLVCQAARTVGGRCLPASAATVVPSAPTYCRHAISSISLMQSHAQLIAVCVVFAGPLLRRARVRHGVGLLSRRFGRGTRRRPQGRGHCAPQGERQAHARLVSLVAVNEAPSYEERKRRCGRGS